MTGRPLVLSAGMCYPVPMEPYELIRSGRKTLALEITRDCRVVVRAPRRLSKAQIDGFVAKHKAWIADHLEQQRRRAALAPSAPTQAEIGALKEKARQVLPPKIAYYSEKMGLFPTGVRITSAPATAAAAERTACASPVFS